MSDETSAGLSLIARLQKKALSEISGMRDDRAVMTAILQRLDGTLAGPVNEVPAMRPRHARLTKRVSDLETNP